MCHVNRGGNFPIRTGDGGGRGISPHVSGGGAPTSCGQGQVCFFTCGSLVGASEY
jgi:hypothetical protein